MINTPHSDNKDKSNSLDMLESNFRNSLVYLNNCILLTLLISVIYIAMLVTGQQIGVPGVSIKLANEFVFSFLTVAYITVGAMAIYAAERANEMAQIFSDTSPPRFGVSLLSPGIGTTKHPGIRMIACYTPPVIMSIHLGYIGYSTSNGGILFPIAIIVSISVTLWSLLPVGKKNANH